MKNLLFLTILTLTFLSCSKSGFNAKPIKDGWKVTMSDTIHEYRIAEDGIYLYSNIAEGNDFRITFGDKSDMDQAEKTGNLNPFADRNMKFLCKRDDKYTYVLGYEDMMHCGYVAYILCDNVMITVNDEGFADAIKLLNMYINRMQ